LIMIIFCFTHSLSIHCIFFNKINILMMTAKLTFAPHDSSVVAFFVGLS